MQKSEKILEEIKCALKEIYLELSNNYSVSDLGHDSDKVACVASKFRCLASNRIEEIIRKHMNDGWISVEERLPDNNENVLVTTDMGLIASGYVAHGKWITDQEPDYPIAWRPLPDPYNPKEDN